MVTFAPLRSCRAPLVLLPFLLAATGCLSMYYHTPDAPEDELAMITGRNIRIVGVDGLSPFGTTAPPIHLAPGRHTLRIDLVDPDLAGEPAEVSFEARAGTRYAIAARRYVVWQGEIHSHRYVEAAAPLGSFADLALYARFNPQYDVQLKWFPYVRELGTGKLVVDSDPDRARGTRALLAYLAWQDTLVEKGGELPFPLHPRDRVKPTE